MLWEGQLLDAGEAGGLAEDASAGCIGVNNEL